MRATLSAALLVGAFFVLVPNANASPCDIGDSDNICVYDYNNGFGSSDCTSEGAQYHWTSASASAGGETVTAYGYEACNHESGYGHTHQGFGVFYNGGFGWYQASHFGNGDTDGAVECGIFVQDNGPSNTGVQEVFLPDEVCLAYGAMPWGDLVR